MTKDQKAQWVADRKNYLGGSEIACLFNMHHYLTPLKLWEYKTGRREQVDITDPSDPVNFSYPAWNGQQDEEKLARWFELKTGLKLYKGSELGTLTHPQYPFIRANIDFWGIDHDGTLFIVETKTTSEWLSKEWKGIMMPDRHEIQCRWYMMFNIPVETLYKASQIRPRPHPLDPYHITKAYLVCQIGNKEPVIREIERDKRFENLMIDTAVDFWTNYVETDKEPPIAESEVDFDLISDRYPVADNTIEPIIVKDNDKIAIAKNIYERNLSIENLKKENEYDKTLLKDYLKDTPVAFFDNVKILWKNHKEKELIDKDLLSEKYPDVYKECLKLSKPSRPFKVTLMDDEEEYNDG